VEAQLGEGGASSIALRRLIDVERSATFLSTISDFVQENQGKHYEESVLVLAKSVVKKNGRVFSSSRFPPCRFGRCFCSCPCYAVRLFLMAPDVQRPQVLLLRRATPISARNWWLPFCSKWECSVPMSWLPTIRPRTLQRIPCLAYSEVGQGGRCRFVLLC
jgi:hypothetical protein